MSANGSGARTPLLWPAALLLVGLLVAVASALEQHRANEALVYERLQSTAQRAAGRLIRRLQTYEYALQGTRSAVIAAGSSAEDISREQFHRYAASVDVERRFPSMSGLAFARRVPVEQEAAFVTSMQHEGFADFRIRQLAPNPGERFVVQYIEPLQDNSAALGLDMASDPTRRETALAALRSGQTRLTPPITLVQAPQGSKRALAFMVPIYRTIVPPEPAQRDKQAFGWANALLVMEQMLRDFDYEEGAFAIALSDITSQAPSVSFFASPDWNPNPQLPLHSLELKLYGRVLQMQVQALPAFTARLNLHRPGSVGAAVTMLSTLLAALLHTRLRVLQRERMLAQQRAQLAAIVHSSHDAIVGHTSEDFIQSWNPAAERLLGWRAEEVIGRSLMELIVPPDRRGEALAMLARVRGGEDVPPFDTVRLDRLACPVDVSLSASPVHAAGSHGVTGAATTMRDIREQQAVRARMEQAYASLEAASQRLRQSEAQARHVAAVLENVIQSIPDPIWATDLEGRWTLLNNATAAVIGRPREALLGVRDHDVLPAAFADAVTAENARILQHGERLEVEQMLLDASRGQVRHYLTTKLPMRASDGRITGLLGLARDITEQRQAQEQLSIAAVAFEAQEGLAVADADGAMLRVNRALCTLCGYAPEDFVGSHFTLLLSDPHGSAAWEVGMQSLSREGRWQGELWIRCSDGSPFQGWVSVTAVQQNHGAATHLVISLTDISQRKRAETALLQSQLDLSRLTQRLMEQEQATTQRLAQLLHDGLGQTVSALQLQLDALDAQGLQPLLAPPQLRHFNTASELAARAGAQVRTALVELRPALLEEEGLTAALVNKLGQLQQEQPDIDLQLSVTPELHALRWPREVEYAFFMVAREALNNAVLHAGAQQIRCILQGAASWLRLQVRDDGRGVMDDPQRAGHLGIVGMRERAFAIGGRFELKGRSGQGSCMELEWEEDDGADLSGG